MELFPLAFFYVCVFVCFFLSRRRGDAKGMKPPNLFRRSFLGRTVRALISLMGRGSEGISEPERTAVRLARYFARGFRFYVTAAAVERGPMASTGAR